MGIEITVKASSVEELSKVLEVGQNLISMRPKTRLMGHTPNDHVPEPEETRDEVKNETVTEKILAEPHANPIIEKTPETTLAASDSSSVDTAEAASVQNRGRGRPAGRPPAKKEAPLSKPAPIVEDDVPIPELAPDLEEKANQALQSLADAAKTEESESPELLDKDITQEKLNEALDEVLSKKSMSVARMILLQFGATKLSQLKAEDYKKFIKTCQKELKA